MKFLRIVKTILYTFYLYVALKLIWLKLTRGVQHQVEIEYIMKKPKLPRIVELHIPKENVTAIYGRFERPIRLPTDFKYILRWTKAMSHYTKFTDRTGQKTFIDHGCEYINCIMTNNDRLLNDYRHFDAIVFDVENNWDYLPTVRASHQNYVLLASEAASTYPKCDAFYDDFYNLTWTYRLDSDIRWSFLTVLNKKNEAVGPRHNMTWIISSDPLQDEIKGILSTKRRAVAWFVSNCRAVSGRARVADALKEELAKFNHVVDIYGHCGNMKCAKSRMEDCLEGMSGVYYFYLAFENSICEDYVTEKVLNAVDHFTVPIVYGGADYSRFMPPGSYLDAIKDNPKTLAAKINEAISNKDVYYSYFRWHKHYKYVPDQPVHDVCQLCKTLHERTGRNTVKGFRHWWLPDYERVCEDMRKELQRRPKLLID